MTDFLAIVNESLQRQTLILLTLSKRIQAAGHPADRISVRPAMVGTEIQYQFTSEVSGQHTHENSLANDAIQRIECLFGTAFRHCHLFTTEADFAARAGKSGAVRVSRSAGTKRPPRLEHNRTKQYVIPDNQPCPFLTEIGVMTAAGKVRANKQRKFRQVNRFLELISDVLPHLPEQGILHVVDFGCGKSYLTFALHHLLTAVEKRDVHILGFDLNGEVIDDCSRIAKRLGCRGLEFRQGDFAQYDSPEKIHMSVSLHACDTATDAAIARGVQWQADVILAVPCCQHEFAETMPKTVLPAVQQYGILNERFAALVTDALRATALEVCGYKTQVVEFIDMEHTAKNLLIRAVRTNDRRGRKESVRRYQQLRAQLGIEPLCLETLLGNRLPMS